MRRRPRHPSHSIHASHHKFQDAAFRQQIRTIHQSRQNHQQWPILKAIVKELDATVSDPDLLTQEVEVRKSLLCSAPQPLMQLGMVRTWAIAGSMVKLSRPQIQTYRSNPDGPVLERCFSPFHLSRLQPTGPPASAPLEYWAE